MTVEGETLAGRFRVERLVKRAQGIETLLAVTLEPQTQVVIRRADAPLSASARARLDHDVAAWNRALDGRVELVGDGARTLLARPWVEGATLAERNRDGRLELRRLVAVAVELLTTLEKIHGAGAIHGDLKPANVVLDGRGRAVLVDFGLARHASWNGPVHALPRDQVAYLAPEQAGLLRQGVDARADLYALGILLYESLTSRAPFDAGSVSEILRQHLTHRPPPPSTLVPGVPAACDRIVERLLRKDPADRYQTAAGARADLEALAAALDAGIADPDIAVGARDRRRALTAPAFIGRAHELAELESALARAVAGEGGLVVVEGASGGGKTWLLDELSRRAASRGAWILHGEGLDQAALRPYQVLAGVAREIAGAAPLGSEAAQKLDGKLGALAAAACEALPELRASLGERVAAPAERGVERSVSACACLLDALGDPARPAVVLLDDAQWADEPTLQLVARWSAERAAARHTLVVLAVRSDALADGHPVRALVPDATLPLRPFSDDEVRRLVASMAGALPDDAAQLVVERAAGDPFLAAAILHGLRDCGALVSDEGGWRIDARALAELQVSGPIADLLPARLSRLAPAARALLTVGATLGRTFDPALAAALAELPLARALDELAACRGSLLWIDNSDRTERSDRDGGACTFPHDRIRDALLAPLSTDDRKRLHHLAAEHLESLDRTRVFELAFHFDAAGEPARALPYALVAGARARAQWDLELAEKNFRIAERGATGAPPPETRRALARGLGEVLLHRNKYDEAARWLDEARALAPDPRARAEVEELANLLALKRGQLGAACERAENALRLLGRWVPRRAPLLLLLCLWEALVQVLHTWLPRLFVARRKLADAGDEFFAIRLFYGLNGPYFYARGAIWAAWAHLRSLNLAERYPPTLELGRARGMHAAAVAGFPSLFARGVRVAESGAALCEAQGDAWGAARSRAFQSMALHFAGRYRESIEAARRAARELDAIGDHWEANTALCFVAASRLRLGDLAGALTTSQELWRRGNQSGGEHALAWALDVWSRANEGHLPPDAIPAARARLDGHLQSSLVLDQAEAVRLLAEGRAREAHALLDASVKRVRKEARFFHDQNAPLLNFRLAALRTQAEQASPLDPARRARLLVEARREAREALAVARRFKNNLPHALREAGLVAALAGDDEGAHAQLDESVAIAVALGARHEEALSREARGRVGVERGWPGAAEEAERARRELLALRPPPERSGLSDLVTTLSLADRFERILDVGRRLTLALTPEAIWSGLLGGVATLLRPERCTILQPTAGGELRSVAGDAGDPIWPSLVRDAFASGHPTVYSAPTDTAPTRARSRSTLCTPIFVHGQPVACLYLTHGWVSGLFGEVEQRISVFLATLAGAALENAENFARVEGLWHELEARVVERTAQLARSNEELERNLVRLRETQDQLLRAGRLAAVGTLVAGLSHELNNPVGVILGYAQILLELTPPDQPAHAMLQAIERQALRCAKLVKALLGFSRRRPSTRAPVAPSELLSSLMDLLVGQARTRKLDIRTRASEGLPQIFVCQQELESALLNLVGNALEATPAGGTIEIRADRGARRRRPGVTFSVRDSGCGMSRDVLPHIFDPFFTTKPAGQGTGLGLSITRQIVLAHEGEIEVESSEGQGTTMLIWLPSSPSPAAVATQERGGA